MALTVSSRPAPAESRSASPGGFSFLSRIRSHKDSFKPSNDTSPYLSSSLRPLSERSKSWETKQLVPSRDSLFSVPAKEGTGLKSRRLSVSAQDDFKVDTCALDEEFVSASKFGLRKECGKGASATVRIMVRRGDKKGEGRKFAVKEFRRRSTKEDEDEYIQKVKSEFTIANSLRHPNIVETFRLCTSGETWNHVMEYCAQGELFSLVDRKYMKAEDKTCIFKQVLRGVEYLHQRGIAHRDIKLENLLMTDAGHIKITDFGVSEVFRGDHPGRATSRESSPTDNPEIRFSTPGLCGSRPYISPEVLAQDKLYDPSKLDVWSCGILYMTLLLNGNPWQSPNPRELNYADFVAGWNDFLAPGKDHTITENNFPQCGRIFNAIPTDKQRRCVFKMLHPHPGKRCTIKEALADRWLKNFDCCSPDSYDRPTTGIDVSKMGGCTAISKMKVQAKHDHLPPPVKRLPQHRFDMGDGTSRYD